MITKSGVSGDEDVLPKFLPFERKYISVGAVWRHNAPQEATRATIFSSDSTSGALEGGDRTFTNKVGALSTTELEAPNEP